jgi:hypothetical protein
MIKNLILLNCTYNPAEILNISIESLSLPFNSWLHLKITAESSAKYTKAFSTPSNCTIAQNSVSTAKTTYLFPLKN